MLVDYFEELFRYNAWANQRSCDAAVTCTPPSSIRTARDCCAMPSALR